MSIVDSTKSDGTLERALIRIALTVAKLRGLVDTSEWKKDDTDRSAPLKLVERGPIVGDDIDYRFTWSTNSRHVSTVDGAANRDHQTPAGNNRMRVRALMNCNEQHIVVLHKGALFLFSLTMS